ncbi:MAG: sulfatase-like hydrolase/transferase [Marinilabiliaceae bacterium]|jgi:arylsulfatase A-like enzyme|nr:sulfatase-like hydrolase/transferase [Marinilabiliaceae bacterium]
MLILLLILASCKQDNQSYSIPERPNILFITTDYTRAADLPIEGHAPFLKAPAISKLCEEGAVFTWHCCVAPICMPSRATIVTGHYPHSHSLWDNRSIPTRQEGRPFLIDDLKKAGYKTAGIGKMHFHPRFDDYNYDLRITLEGKDLNYQADDYEKYLESKGTSRKDLRKIGDDGKWPRGMSFFDWTADEELHPDVFVGSQAVESVKAGFLDGEKPWFMWVSFTGPHNPWNAPGRLASYYRDMEDLPAGEFADSELETKPIEYSRHRYGYGGNLFHIYDTMPEAEQAKVRKDLRAGHYGLISLIDEQIGDILNELDRRNLLENTIVIFSSDHGSALFDNNMLHKGSSFTRQSLVPFVVWGPGIIKPGIRDNFTTNADLYSTFLDLAGYTGIPQNEGFSFRKMLTDTEASIRDYAIIESTMVTSVMTKEWIMGIHHISGQTDLYSLRDDPMCLYNLAEDSRYADVISELRDVIVDWRKSLPSGNQVGDDPYTWFGELGDTNIVSKYFTGYINEYRALANLPDERPGITGKAAQEIIDAIENK